MMVSLFSSFSPTPRALLYLSTTLSCGVFLVTFGGLFLEVADLTPDATLYQCLYLALSIYMESTFHYIVVDSLMFAVMFWVFDFCRVFVFKGTSFNEVTGVLESAMNLAAFRILFLGAVLDVDLIEFGVWSLITEVTMLLKCIVAIAIKRQRVNAGDDAVANDSSHCLRFAMTLVVSLCCFSALTLMWYVTVICIQLTGAIPVLLLLFDTGTVVVDCAHFFALWLLPVRSGAFKRHSVDLVVRSVVFAIPLLHYLTIWLVRGISFSMLDFLLVVKVRTALGGCYDCLSKYSAFVKVVQRIDHSFASPTHTEMIDEICSICREPLTVGAAKKLPCTHLYHFDCLVKWMRYKRICPICRRDIHVNESNGNGPRLERGGQRQGGAVQRAADGRSVAREQRRAGNGSFMNLLSRLVPAPPTITDAMVTHVSEVLGRRFSNEQIRSQLTLDRGSMNRSIEHFLAL